MLTVSTPLEPCTSAGPVAAFATDSICTSLRPLYLPNFVVWNIFLGEGCAPDHPLVECVFGHAVRKFHPVATAHGITLAVKRGVDYGRMGGDNGVFPLHRYILPRKVNYVKPVVEEF